MRGTRMKAIYFLSVAVCLVGGISGGCQHDGGTDGHQAAFRDGTLTQVLSNLLGQEMRGNPPVNDVHSAVQSVGQQEQQRQRQISQEYGGPPPPLPSPAEQQQYNNNNNGQQYNNNNNGQQYNNNNNGQQYGAPPQQQQQYGPPPQAPQQQQQYGPPQGSSGGGSFKGNKGNKGTRSFGFDFSFGDRIKPLQRGPRPPPPPAKQQQYGPPPQNGNFREGPPAYGPPPPPPNQQQGYSGNQNQQQQQYGPPPQAPQNGNFREGPPAYGPPPPPNQQQGYSGNQNQQQQQYGPPPQAPPQYGPPPQAPQQQQQYGPPSAPPQNDKFREGPPAYGPPPPNQQGYSGNQNQQQQQYGPPQTPQQQQQQYGAPVPQVMFIPQPQQQYGAPGGGQEFQQFKTNFIAQQQNVENLRVQEGVDTNSIGGGDDPSVDTKFVYLFAPPVDPNEAPPKPQKISYPGASSGGRDKNYQIIFVKAPAGPEAPPVEIQMPPLPERKTMVYVLVKKPIRNGPNIRFTSPPSTTPSPPEVFFVKYRRNEKMPSTSQFRSLPESIQDNLMDSMGEEVEEEVATGGYSSGQQGRREQMADKLRTTSGAGGYSRSSNVQSLRETVKVSERGGSKSHYRAPGSRAWEEEQRETGGGYGK